MSTKKSTKKPASKSAAKNTKTIKSTKQVKRTSVAKSAKCAQPNKVCGIGLTIFFGVAGLVVVALLVVWACVNFNG
ncbi:hypothetical protein IKD60_00905 [Candidatus Saccharibacteria bacterium]|nr:hypothetical protein [Candidatus Saccharibacteria bacterium]